MNRRPAWAVAVAALGTTGPLAVPLVAQPSLERVQHAPPVSNVWGVSGNGRVLFGEGFRQQGGDPMGALSCIWTVGGCPQLIPIQPWAISFDGTVVAGRLGRATIWNRTTSEMIQVDDPSDRNGVASGISRDGSVVVGKRVTASGELRAFRWTAQEGLVDVGPCGALFNWYATTLVSADGSVVVVTLPTRVYRWTESGGASDLPLDADDVAVAVSADGATVVGWTYPDRAFRWREDTGVTLLPNEVAPGGLTPLRATAVSGDGSLVGGLGYSSGGYEPFIWDEAHGTRRLLVVLRDEYGVNTGGFFNQSVEGISADGSTIVGGFIGPPDVGRGGWVGRFRFCLPDWDTDGAVESMDFLAFLTDFFDGRADVDGDCATTSGDFFEYLTAYFAGCP